MKEPPARGGGGGGRSALETMKALSRPPPAPFAGLGRCLVARLRGPGPLKAEEARDARDPVKWGFTEDVNPSMTVELMVLLAVRTM